MNEQDIELVRETLNEVRYLKDNISEEDFKYSQKIADDIMNTSNGAKLKSLGRMFKGLDSKNWNDNASKEMKIALKASFEQNDKSKEILLSTGNSELTHTQDSGKWKIEFPKLLMEVREELGGQKFISNKPQQLSLFDQLEQDKQRWEEVKDKWIESGRTEADFNSMSNEEREHIIENCL